MLTNDCSEESRFAGTVPSEEGCYVALEDLEGDAFQDVCTTYDWPESLQL